MSKNAYLETSNGFVPWTGQPIDGIRYPRNIVDLWSAEQRAAIDVYIPAEPDAVPENKVVTETIVDRVGGVVKYVHVLAGAPPPGEAEIDAERDRRIAAGFTFGGVIYQSRPEDRENIMGAATAALGAMMTGAQAGDYRWHGGDSDFMWIAADNSTHPMDAQTVYAFGLAAMAHKTAHIFAARAFKDADPIPVDYTDDGYWP